jgi:receptor protein-tyrosine kinase
LAAQKILSELRVQFDYVIVDSSPLLAVTDGAVIAASADGALVAVRFGKTTRDQLSHAVGNLNNVGASLLGAVMTMMPTRGSESYSYNYHYGKSYGDREPTDDPNRKARPHSDN